MFGIVAQWLDLLSDKDKIWNYILLKSGIQIKHLYENYLEIKSSCFLQGEDNFIEWLHNICCKQNKSVSVHYSRLPSNNINISYSQ